MESLLNLPTTLPPELLASALAFTGVFIALSLLWRDRSSGIPSALLSLGISLLALSTLPSLGASIPLAIAGALAIIKASLSLKRFESRGNLGSTGADLFAFVLFLIIACLLLRDLDSYSYKPLVWEAVVIDGLTRELSRHVDFTTRLYSRLFWSEGLLSEGNRSLLYGLATSEILPQMPSMFGARIASVVFTLGSVFALFLMMRRLFNPTVAAISVGIFGLNEITLIFGRYGSSIAGSFFGLILAWWACAHVTRHPSFASALLASGSLFVATLGYAPARLMVMVLAPLTAIGILVSNPARIRSRIVAVTSMAVTVGLLVWWQKSHYRLDSFVSGRLETVPGMFITGYWPDFLLPTWKKIENPGRIFEWSHYLTFAKGIISQLTFPNFITVLSPFSPEERTFTPFYADPLFLKVYAPILLPFIVTGMVTMRRFQHRWLNATLWASSLWSVALLLLTNRIDSYRAAFIFLPVTMWAAVGLFQFLDLLRERAAGRLIALLLCLGSVYAFAAPRFIDLTRAETTRLTTKTTALPLLPMLPVRPIIGVEASDFRVLAELSLDTLQRRKANQQFSDHFLSDSELNSLASSDLPAITALTNRMQRGIPLLIGPVWRFAPLAAELSSRGYTVRVYPARLHPFFIIAPPETASKIPFGAIYDTDELRRTFGPR